MSSTRDQQLARARAARQAQRQQERARQRRIVAAALVGVLVVAGAGVGIGVAVSGGDSKNTVSAADPSTSATPTSAATPTAAATPTPAPLPAKVACNGPKDSLTPASRVFASEPDVTIDTKAKYTMTLDTSCGKIVIALEAAKAPHTVNLLSFLAAGKFYDGSYCHRATNTASLTVLQCGDPTETGAGSIGFTIKEENLTGATYPRGTLAMAKTSAANSTGSQFFLVDKDSDLPPQYTVAGHITSGLDVLDKLQAVGDDDSNGTGDGSPKEAIFLNTVTVTKG